MKGVIKMKVICKLDVIESVIDEEQIRTTNIIGDRLSPEIEVISHWSYSDRVGIKFSGNPNVYFVISDDLIRAVKNASNHCK